MFSSSYFFLSGKGVGGRSYRKLSDLGILMLNHPWECCFIQKFLPFILTSSISQDAFICSVFFKKNNTTLYLNHATLSSRHVASGCRGGPPPLNFFSQQTIFLNLHIKKWINMESPPPIFWEHVKNWREFWWNKHKVLSITSQNLWWANILNNLCF